MKKSKRGASRQSAKTGFTKKRGLLTVLLLAFVCLPFLLLGSAKTALGLGDGESGGYDVSARVALTTPAVITSPVPGASFTSKPITVTGTCPKATYVQLFRNNFPSGTVLCDSTGHFSIDTDLFDGLNNLMVKVYTLENEQGPDSEIVAVTYNQSSGSGSAGAGTGGPVLVKYDFEYQGYNIGDTIVWVIEISGGTPPYAIHVDWGDGTSDLYSLAEPGRFEMKHRYTRAASLEEGGFTVRFRVTDANGEESTLQSFAIIKRPERTYLGGLIETREDESVLGATWRKYGEYFIVSSAIILLGSSTFWLGEAHRHHLDKKLQRRKAAARARRAKLTKPKAH